MAPQVQFKPLSRADGSATYSDNLFSILSSVNGPIEVQRRDELPEEATVEVNVRPLSGVGGPRERWLEDIVHSVLRSVLLVHSFPRSLIQVTLQITKEPGTRFTKGRGDVCVLPALVNAAFVGLVDAGLPLRTTAVAGLVTVQGDRRIVRDVNEKELSTCKSVHAMAYDKDGMLLLDESLGTFDVTTWEQVANDLRDICLGAVHSSADDNAMVVEGDGSYPWMREAFEDKVKQANAWRETT